MVIYSEYQSFDLQKFDSSRSSVIPYLLYIILREVWLVDWGFGLTMTIWGMGITLFTLGLLILVIRLMNKIYPYKKDEESKKD